MKEQIIKFLNTELTEADYFSLSKDGLITLKDYLTNLDAKDREFTIAIRKQFDSIKEKCSWLSSITFGGLVHENGTYELTAIYLYSEDGIDLVAVANRDTEKYEDLTKNIPKLYLLSGKVRKHLARQKDIDLIQDELCEIENVGREMYKDVLRPLSSASDNFTIHYSPHFGLSVYNDFDLIASYLSRAEKHKEKEYIKDEESKTKLLKRIMISPNGNK